MCKNTHTKSFELQFSGAGFNHVKNTSCRFICLLRHLFGFCGTTNMSSTNEGGDNDLIYDFYTDVDNIVIWVGESKFSFDTPNDVEDICVLFENVIGDKIPNDSSQIEEFYEIVFFSREKQTSVILTGPTIIIDGVGYYTKNDIIIPLSEYLR